MHYIDAYNIYIKNPDVLLSSKEENAYQEELLLGTTNIKALSRYASITANANFIFLHHIALSGTKDTVG